MKLTEALLIHQRAPKDADLFSVALACGFTPLHMQTFLRAHLQRAMPLRRVEVATGLYGDTAGTLESLRHAPDVHGVALALEWPDLDPRLGYRSAGLWGPANLSGILASARAGLDRIAGAIEALPDATPVAISLPSLALPPLFSAPGWQMASAELALTEIVIGFAARVVRREGVSLVNDKRLAEESPVSGRHDCKSDLATGLPYTVAHASAAAGALARLLAPPPPKKGLITDLDNTLWRGIVGEAGPENVSWDLAGHGQIHGLYQKLLASLSEEGVLIGIASKNDPSIVDQAFQRKDLLLPPDRVFPRLVHWNAKSGSIEQILRAWNIGADSAVFVDDSPMELAEAAAAHPGMECVLFPHTDPASAPALLHKLRDLFGKPRISDEDTIRLDSLRQGAEFTAEQGIGAPEAFLSSAQAIITADLEGYGDPRALELVNKTNQFNLNGLRRTPADWKAQLAREGAFLAVISYQDRFGPLGKIAVVQGAQRNETLYIDTWVMSCRAFSRRIEHQCLKTLFHHFNARRISFEFQPTAKNGPARDFLEQIAGVEASGRVTLAREQFETSCPPLYHQVEIRSNQIQCTTTSTTTTPQFA